MPRKPRFVSGVKRQVSESIKLNPGKPRLEGRELHFWAAWCGPCKMMAPVFAQAARQLQPRVRLAKINTEKDQELATRYGIMSIPTIVLFKNGQEQARISGAMDFPRLLAWVQQHI